MAPIPRTALPHEALRVALSALERGVRVVTATVVARHGSAPATPGQKLVLTDEGEAVGTVGGGAVERAVMAAMTSALADPSALPRVETFRLGPDLGMCCGGSVDVLLEPQSPSTCVLVVGAGHVGVFTAPLLAALGFSVTLCDGREEAADPTRLAQPMPQDTLGDSPLEMGHAPSPPTAAVELLHADHDDPEVLSRFPSALATAAAIVMTHDHQLDQAAVEWALAKGFGFVGGVGSRAKAARTRARLEAKGVSSHDIARVRMPVGVDIGARSPQEIAVAIAAEIVAWRASLRASRSRGQHLPGPRAPA